MPIEKILLLGGTRFIGPAIVRCLRERGLEVTVFHRGIHSADIPLSVQERFGDRNNLAVLRDLVTEIRPDVVIDTFAMTEQIASVTLEALRQWSGRLIMLSSCDVYRNFGGAMGLESEPPSTTPLTETSPLRENLYPYRATPPRIATDPQAWRDQYDKIPVERAYLEAGAIVLRLPMVYGPGDYQHRMAPYLKRMVDGRKGLILSEELARYVFPRGYIGTVAEAVCLAADSDRRAEVYNVADENPYEEMDWVEQIANIMQWTGEIKLIPDKNLPATLQSGLNHDYGLEISAEKFFRDFGNPAKQTPQQCLEATVSWEIANMPTLSVEYEEEDALLAV